MIAKKRLKLVTNQDQGKPQLKLSKKPLAIMNVTCEKIYFQFVH